MYYRKIPFILSVISFAGITLSSLSIMRESAMAYAVASWIKPFCAIGFVSGLSIYYVSMIGRKTFVTFVSIFLLSSFFFLTGFFINAIFFKNYLSLFYGFHSYILTPSLIAVIIMLCIAMTKRAIIPPFDSINKTVVSALMPMYVILVASLCSSLMYTGNTKIQWLSKDYLVMPAVYKKIDFKEKLRTDNTIYSGPLEVTYSMDFIELYEKVINEKVFSSEQDHDSEITDFAVFSDYYMFIKKSGESTALLVYGKDASFIKRIDNISRIYHSDNALAVVTPVNNHVRMYDTSLNEMFRITLPPSFTVEKVVFSYELFAILYSIKDTGFELPDKFSIIYRLDTGDRIGRLASADIAPRLKTTGFVTVDNTDEGLSLTVLDRNSNKKRYLFKSDRFSSALIRQCGADRFFVKAQSIENGDISKEYLLVYNLNRSRRIHESLRAGTKTRHSKGNIIAVIGKFLLSDKDVMLDNNLNEIFQFKKAHNIPYRILMSPQESSSFIAEGSISNIDFSPFLNGYSKTIPSRVLLADMKGTLTIKQVLKFSDYFLVIANNRIFIYDKKLQLLKRIDLPENGHISKVRILNNSILLTFYTEESIEIYSIDPDFNAVSVTSIHTKQGKIWDISEELIVYGQEFSSSSETKRYGDSAIMIVKGLNSDLMYQRVLMSSLYASPAIHKSRLILPFTHMTEIVELKSGKRTVMNGNIMKAGNTSYGITNSGHVIELSTLDPFPYTFDPHSIGTNIDTRTGWIDLHGYLLNPETSGIYVIVRSGLTSLGENSVCSSTGSMKRKVVNCIDLDTMNIFSTFSFEGNFEIVYSDPDIIFLRNNHSLIAIDTKNTG